MQEEFQEVLTAVRSNPHMDSNVVEMANDLAAGKLDLVSALNTVRFLSEDIVEHTDSLGDASGKWEDFVQRVSACYESKPPFTLVSSEKQLSRR